MVSTLHRSNQTFPKAEIIQLPTLFCIMNSVLKISRCFQPVLRHYSLRTKFDQKLSRHLEAKIKFSGPLTVYEYMKEALTNPVSGYYMKGSVFGSTGDFITSPQISQVFGELIAVWIYNEWHKMGAPSPLKLIELGPGTGTLIMDIVRTLKQLKIRPTDIQLHLVEKSTHLSTVQDRNICQKEVDSFNAIPSTLEETYRMSSTKDGVEVRWHYDFSYVPEGFSFTLAHELFDALPIHKFKKTESGWREVLIDFHDDKFRYVLSNNETPASKVLVREDEPRSELEVCPEAAVLAQRISDRVAMQGGGALIIDYGHDGTRSDTFRAFRGHKQVDPLEDPGSSDITADVDFSMLRQCAGKHTLAFGPVDQRDFLLNMGIEVRMKRLMEKKTSEERIAIEGRCARLIDPSGMGTQYKFMAFLPKVMKPVLDKLPPAGFKSLEL